MLGKARRRRRRKRSPCRCRRARIRRRGRRSSRLWKGLVRGSRGSSLVSTYSPLFSLSSPSPISCTASPRGAASSALTLSLWPSRAVLHQLAIDPSLQRTGAGKALVQACLDFAQKHDPPLDLYLDSTDGELSDGFLRSVGAARITDRPSLVDQTAGRPLYDHLGFVQWDKTTTVGEGWPEVSARSESVGGGIAEFGGGRGAER
ncbi:hypothetical protein BCR35DRAFT_305373 [Leucosporidium creatinivorum]|uniref:N-acetyltransferase domain-containing protein n=1 Tax=Leucosporidium creatinivorum TaxID=106004 RepID=A0A1Y2F193_9BASI|nr:hypothetical protein BCR35DRAFT_305373 [Leucosporidium creatinivorum]